MPEAFSVLIHSLLSTLYLFEKRLLQTRLYRNISNVNVNRKERYHRLRKQPLKMPTKQEVDIRFPCNYSADRYQNALVRNETSQNLSSHKGSR